MFGDFPVPDFGFEDDEPCSLICPTPASTHHRGTDDDARQMQLHGLAVDLENPIRCTSNSSVYKATSTDGGEWAVKVTSNRRRLEDEFVKARCLPSSSPYLVQTVGFFQLSAKSVLQMEFCPYGDIAMTRFDETDVWQLIHDVATALSEVHRLGWMHLDVSPSNILRGDGVFKLADFGTLTRIGEFVEGNEGAGPYVSPEALAHPFGSHQVSGQTDIFSLGVVLLEALTGKLAPRGGSEGYRELRKGRLGIGSDRYQCLCSEDMKTLVNAMLAADPDCRPAAIDLVEIAAGRF
jgi:serine/threonine protein kinase